MIVRKILSKSAGSALIQSLIAVVLLGLVTTNLVTVFGMMNKGTAFVNFNQIVSTSVDEGRLVMGKTQICTLNFRNKTIGAIGAFPVALTGTGWDSLAVKGPGVDLNTLGADIFATGRQLGRGIQVSNVQTILTGRSGNTFYGNIQVSFSTPDGSVAGPEELTRRIPIRFETTTSGGVTTVNSCGSQPELNFGCRDEIAIEYPLNTAGDPTLRFNCSSASAEITGCRQQQMPQGSLFCGTTIAARSGVTPPYCQTSGCVAPGATQFWRVTLTCCESGGPAPLPPAPATAASVLSDCRSVTPAFVSAGTCGFNASVSCAADEVAVSGGTTAVSNVSTQSSAPIISGTKVTGWASGFILDSSNCASFNSSYPIGTTASAPSFCFGGVGGYCGAPVVVCCR